MIVTGTPAALAARRATEISAAESIFTSTSAGPPTRKVVKRAMGARGMILSGAKLACTSDLIRVSMQSSISLLPIVTDDGRSYKHARKKTQSAVSASRRSSAASRSRASAETAHSSGESAQERGAA